MVPWAFIPWRSPQRAPDATSNAASESVHRARRKSRERLARLPRQPPDAHSADLATGTEVRRPFRAASMGSPATETARPAGSHDGRVSGERVTEGSGESELEAILLSSSHFENGVRMVSPKADHYPPNEHRPTSNIARSSPEFPRRVSLNFRS